MFRLPEQEPSSESSEEYSAVDGVYAFGRGFDWPVLMKMKITTVLVIETSVTNNGLSEDYSHPNDHAKQTTNTPGCKPFAIIICFFVCLFVCLQSYLSGSEGHFSILLSA